ncbi:substrate-binding domain-containing protein [Methylobacterium nigriterrae]|uniref:substrate-binding domain-containing protein n=1 Tax=Methylobacterium nigriterrae TaxID=3127512 RepID=UPI0030137BD6
MQKPAVSDGITAELALGGTLRLGAQGLAVADVLALLTAIEEAGSLQGVAATLGLSYRAAWDRVRSLEATVGRPVVQKTRGHGTVLTPTGLALSRALADAASALAASLAREARAVEVRLAGLLGDAPRRLAIAASHDLVVMDAVASLTDCEVAVVGSRTAVQRLLAGEADVAGFHCGPVSVADAGTPFANLLDEPALCVRPLFEREQGLLLAPGNPLGVRSLRDLVSKRARYVNRQKGSGTRIWFDRLLSDQGIAPSDIMGYGVEEFTHQAVAAVIATRSADAGLGARSAAERFGLHFLSIGWETYYLAASASLPAERLDRLAASVMAQAERSAGYKVTSSSVTAT